MNGKALPPELYEVYERLAAEPLRSPTLLKAAIIAHRAQISDHANRQPHADLDMAYRLVEVCFALLRGWDALDLASRHAVQAGCRYLALREDGGGDDFASEGGLDDDCEVLNHVCALLGRSDLVIERE